MTSETEENTRSGRDEEAVSRFVERFASEMTEAGMQRMASRVFAALLADDDGSMTSAELAVALQISPAAVSGAVSYLTQVSMVGRERDPGSRRDRYRLIDEVWFSTFASRDRVLTRWESTLKEGVRILGEDTPAGCPDRRDGGVLRVPAGGAGRDDGPLARAPQDARPPEPPRVTVTSGRGNRPPATRSPPAPPAHRPPAAASP